MIFLKTKMDLWIAALSLVLFASGTALAADFQTLVSDGYQIGKMSKRSGQVGWVLSKGKQKFFCVINPSLVKGADGKFYLIDISGSLVDWEKRPMRGMGMMINPDAVPELDDLKAGRVTAIHVGECKATR